MLHYSFRFGLMATSMVMTCSLMSMLGNNLQSPALDNGWFRGTKQIMICFVPLQLKKALLGPKRFAK